jgi:predicted phosphodiesterase
MKIAALADIHGNYQALITVLDHVERWNPDLVLVLGDTINRGSRSKECLHLIQQKQLGESWQVIKGNHEEYVLEFDDPTTPKTGPQFEMMKIIYWTYQELSPEDISAIKEQPKEIRLTLPDGGTLTGVHASLGGIRVGIYPDHDQIELQNLIDPLADLFLVGHTHQPLVRNVGKTLVVNAGSIGLPFDGDIRTGYAQLVQNNREWSAKIVRFEYDIDAAKKDLYNTDFIPDGGPLANLVQTELEIAWPQLSYWFKRYESLVMEGKIEIDQAVQEFLKNPHRE